MKSLLKITMLYTLLISSILRADGDFDLVFDAQPNDEITLDELNALGNAAFDPSAIRLSPGVIGFILSKVKTPLWKTTNSPAGRDMLYLLPHKITAIEYGGYAINFFYNMTDQMHVTVDDLFNFLSINLSELEELMGQFIPKGIDLREITQLLPLFKKITLQEHKSGFLIQSGFTKGPVTLQIHTSLQLGARNFWLNAEDVAAIKAVFKEKFGGGELDEGQFYKIRFGMGDTRLKIGLNTINMTSFKNDVGLETILPTSRLSYTPKIKLGVEEIILEINSSSADEVKQCNNNPNCGNKEANLQNSAINTLQAIRDDLLNPRLGNNGHWGLGCYWEAKIGLFHEMVQLWIRASYDVLFPNEEDRLFMFKQTLTPDDVLHAGNDEAGRKLVNEYIRQYVFPSSFKSTVHPGGVVNFVSVITTDFGKRYRWALGYDFYAKGEEHIKAIHNTNVDIQSLRVEDARSPSAQQHKIFTEIMYHKKGAKKDFGLGLGGDLTVASKGIGEDWTAYFKIASSF